MSTVLRLALAAFELFNKLATRFREMRITRAIKRDITNKAREKVADAKKRVKQRLRKGGYFPDDD